MTSLSDLAREPSRARSRIENACRRYRMVVRGVSYRRRAGGRCLHARACPQRVRTSRAIDIVHAAGPDRFTAPAEMPPPPPWLCFGALLLGVWKLCSALLG